MNIETNTASLATAARSNILGVTGLSRAVLAEMFRRRGLFGRDSRLSNTEQAVVQSRLPSIAGIAALPVISQQTPRLKALGDYVEALVAGRDARDERTQLLAAGLPAAALHEAAVTVDNLRLVFGPLPTPRAAATPVVAEAAGLPQYARAA